MTILTMRIHPPILNAIPVTNGEGQTMRQLRAGWVIATATAVISGGMLTAAPASAAPSLHQPVPHVTTAQPIPKSGTHGVIGKSADGRVFSYTWRSEASAPSIQEFEAAPALCSYYVSDLTYNRPGSSSYFSWSTTSTCTGSFGSVKHSTQVWRSSWRGWIGYSSWATSAYRSEQSVTWTWTVPCGDSGGWYDYVAALKIYATNIGVWSPVEYSKQSQS